MGCQKSIFKSIVEQGGDYVITLKKNQPSLYARVEELFKQALRQGFSGFTHTAYSTKKESNHGRSEIRHHVMLSDIKELIDPDNQWEKLHSIGMIESVRIVKGKTTIETRYYISGSPNNALSFW
jgi:predicted transposase YbfD/YdcC